MGLLRFYHKYLGREVTPGTKFVYLVLVTVAVKILWEYTK